jgi:hypothetical protein
MRKSHAIHLAGHLDIGAHQRNVGPGFRMATASAHPAPQWHVSGVYRHVDHAHAKHHLVLDNENDGGMHE